MQTAHARQFNRPLRSSALRGARRARDRSSDAAWEQHRRGPAAHLAPQSLVGYYDRVASVRRGSSAIHIAKKSTTGLMHVSRVKPSHPTLEYSKPVKDLKCS